MVHAWQRGDTTGSSSSCARNWAAIPASTKSLLAARNRKWVPKIEALLNDDGIIW